MELSRKIWELIKHMKGDTTPWYFSIKYNIKLPKRSNNRCCRQMESSLRKLIWDFLRTLTDMLRHEWPSNKAHTSCVIWSKMEFYWRRRCAITCPTPGTFLTTGLVKNFSRCIAKDSFPSNSYQFSISAIISLRYYGFLNLCIRLRHFACFNSILY